LVLSNFIFLTDQSWRKCFMRKPWLMCVLLGTLAGGQAMPGAAPQAPADDSASVPATAAVITIDGVCPDKPRPTLAKGTPANSATGAKSATAKSTRAPQAATTKSSPADCKTVITKAEFETLAGHLAPNVTSQMKKQLANLLPQWIALSSKAKKEGLDKTPQFEDRVKVLKMQILSQELRQNIQEEAGNIPSGEIEKYYNDHASDFEQFNLQRLFVPLNKQNEAEVKDEEKNEKLSDEAQKAKEAEQKAKMDEGQKAMTELAESLRTRAAAGEDFAKLQKEAYEAAGMKIEAPTVTLPTVRRAGLPPAQAAVFDVKVGEVSQVINDSSGHYIFKVMSKSAIPLDQAKNEIHGKLQNERMRKMMEDLNNSFKVETNEAYFGAPLPNGPMGPGQRMPPPRMQNPGNGPGSAPHAQPQSPPPAQPPAAQPN
jgi:peptidyl-prolyl cis-trans isomerase C